MSKANEYENSMIRLVHIGYFCITQTLAQLELPTLTAGFVFHCCSQKMQAQNWNV